jgi:hypothetical protein
MKWEWLHTLLYNYIGHSEVQNHINFAIACFYSPTFSPDALGLTFFDVLYHELSFVGPFLQITATVFYSKNLLLMFVLF